MRPELGQLVSQCRCQSPGKSPAQTRFRPGERRFFPTINRESARAISSSEDQDVFIGVVATPMVDVIGHDTACRPNARSIAARRCSAAAKSAESPVLEG